MKTTVLLVAFAVILSTAVMASPQVAVLDGTSWKIEVEPDGMAKDKGEKQFKETLTFADGNVSLSAPKVGFEASPYSITKSAENQKDLNFKAERSSTGEGNSILTGMVHENNVKGKLIWTKNDGTVLTYSFSGNKLD